MRIFEENHEYTCTRCEKYSSKLDISRSFMRIFAIEKKQRTMKILLLGEYSNVHSTLANALRRLGHEVCLVSNGDDWKGYSADIPLVRRSGRWGSIIYLIKVLRLLPKLRGYDVVQLINPVHFVDLKAERGIRIYNYLRRHNKKIFLGAFGTDYYYVYDSAVRRTLRYCDFYTPTREIKHEWNTINVNDWLHTYKKEACIHVAETCDGIISGLYEYDVAYRPYFPDKTTFIPFPIDMNAKKVTTNKGEKIRFFIGIQRHRSALKGTDVMLRALERIVADYPDRAEMIKAESVPFAQYKEMLNSSDVLLDQLYSYTPAMNALQAMSQGLIVVSGGEELRPIINVQPDEEDVYKQLEELVLHPERIRPLKQDSITYIERHHESMKVARQYLAVWSNEKTT